MEQLFGRNKIFSDWTEIAASMKLHLQHWWHKISKKICFLCSDKNIYDVQKWDGREMLGSLIVWGVFAHVKFFKNWSLLNWGCPTEQSNLDQLELNCRKEEIENQLWVQKREQIGNKCMKEDLSRRYINE